MPTTMLSEIEMSDSFRGVHTALTLVPECLEKKTCVCGCGRSWRGLPQSKAKYYSYLECDPRQKKYEHNPWFKAKIKPA